MEEREDPRRVAIEESEIRPNRFALKALLGVLAALLLSCILNEFGIFEADRKTIWECFGCFALLCVGAWLLVRDPRIASDPKTKFVLMGMALFLTLTVSVFLNISAVLMLLLPLFLATRYRSVSLSFCAVGGSIICCVLSPILAWCLGAWSLPIMLGYLETMCGVSPAALNATTLGGGTILLNILVYHCLPQLLVILAFGSITLSITRDSIDGLQNRLRVMELSERLSGELDRVASMQERVIFSMADVIESRDLNTGDHVKRTSEVVRVLVQDIQKDQERKLTEEFCENVVKAAPLHDIGKITIDDSILRKPGPLSAEERALINLHPARGAELLRTALGGIEDEHFMAVAENIVLCHHERYDGRGYPEGLRGDEIPLEARIMAIADVYDALVSRRSYKAAVSPDEAYRIIEEAMGTQFDPALGVHFTRVREEIERLYRES